MFEGSTNTLDTTQGIQEKDRELTLTGCVLHTRGGTWWTESVWSQVCRHTHYVTEWSYSQNAKIKRVIISGMLIMGNFSFLLYSFSHLSSFLQWAWIVSIIRKYIIKIITIMRQFIPMQAKFWEPILKREAEKAGSSLYVSCRATTRSKNFKPT